MAMSSPVSSWVPPSLPEPYSYDDVSRSVLLDRWCYIADLPNDTTAEGVTSIGLPITVTFYPARPPVLFHFCVHCPGLEFRRTAPKVVATNADPLRPHRPRQYHQYTGLGLLRLQAADPAARSTPKSEPRMSRRPLVSEGGARYAVAALGVRPPVYDGAVLISWEYDLHLYRSSNAEEWITKRLSVHEC